MRLPTLSCPGCGQAMVAPEAAEIQTTRGFADCLRRCEPCGVGASNSRTDATHIWRDPLDNIPPESRSGADEVLRQAMNLTSRRSKRVRFGFSTSEDAVTWVVFTYLLRSGNLARALQRSGIGTGGAAAPAVLLWGAPVDGGPGQLREELERICTDLGERPDRFSEPDVIVDLGDELVFIEVKHGSQNDRKDPAYDHWSRYECWADLAWDFEEVRASGCYELARNWCLMKRLAAHRRATLVNLGPRNLFAGSQGERVNRFINALPQDDRSRFVKLTWDAFLGNEWASAPQWFSEFCRTRGLVSRSVR